MIAFMKFLISILFNQTHHFLKLSCKTDSITKENYYSNCLKHLITVCCDVRNVKKRNQLLIIENFLLAVELLKLLCSVT